MTSRSEQALRDRAVAYACPACGAKAGIRCRILMPNVTNPKRMNVRVKKNPCAERTSLAWPDMLAEMTR